jgi:hypothetical protein
MKKEKGGRLKDLREEPAGKGNAEAMNLSEMFLAGGMDRDIYRDLRTRVELSLACLEDGAAHTAIEILRQLCGPDAPKNMHPEKTYLPDCLITENHFQLEGKIYYRDARSGSCYCYMGAPYPGDRRPIWPRIAPAVYLEKYTALLKVLEIKEGEIKAV